MYVADYATNTDISGSQKKVSKPTLVLMAGFPGAGKTTLARELGYNLQWPTIDKDVLKISLLNANRGVTPESAAWLAYDLFFTLASDLLVKQGLSIILDSAALRPFIIEKACELVYEANAEFRIIFCQAPYDVRIDRIRKRNEQFPKYQLYTHPTMFTEQDGLECFAHLPTDRTERVDTTKSLSRCLQQALNYIQGYSNILI